MKQRQIAIMEEGHSRKEERLEEIFVANKRLCYKNCKVYLSKIKHFVIGKFE